MPTRIYKVKTDRFNVTLCNDSVGDSNSNIFTVLLGKNGTGKSNILKQISYALPDSNENIPGFTLTSKAIKDCFDVDGLNIEYEETINYRIQKE